jgi:hypothetical protein
MFNNSGSVFNFYIREGICTAFIAQQQRIALRIITGICGPLTGAHQSAVTIVDYILQKSLWQQFCFCIFAQMYHFGACISLLMIIGKGNRIKFTN